MAPHSKVPDPKKRELAFKDLNTFIADEKAVEPTNLAEMMEAAGATLDHLAGPGKLPPNLVRQNRWCWV